MYPMYQGYGAPNQNRGPGFPPPQQIKPEPLDWNLVSILDPVIIQKVKDFDSLQKIVTNFLAANFTPNCSKILQNPLALRLCQLLQLGFQFMDESQRELKKIIDENAVYKQKMINALKKLKSKLQQTEEKLKIKSIPYDKCPICSKKFKSIDYVDKHIISKHEELLDCWECIRGRKKPEKEPELQLVLEEIARLRASIKQGNISTNQNSEDQLWINSEQSRNQNASEELDEAAQTLSESVKLWNEVNRFDIFNKPSNYVPPSEISNPQRPFFVEEKDIHENEADALALFAAEGGESQETENNQEEEEEIDESDIPPSLGLPQVNANLQPEQPQRLFGPSPAKDKEKLIKAAKKFVYKPQKPILETAKKSEISDSIDHVRKQAAAQVKQFTNAINGDAITPTFVRRNIAINDPDYADLRNYIQSRLEHEYPLSGDKLESQIAPRISNNGESRPINFNLIKTGELNDESRSGVLSEITASDIHEDAQDELPSFSYETLDPPNSPTIISTAAPIVGIPMNEPEQTISIVEEDISPKTDSSNDYSDTGGLSDMPNPPHDMFNASDPLKNQQNVENKQNSPQIKQNLDAKPQVIEQKPKIIETKPKQEELKPKIEVKQNSPEIKPKVTENKPKQVESKPKLEELKQIKPKIEEKKSNVVTQFDIRPDIKQNEPIKQNVVPEETNMTFDDAPHDSLLELEQIFKPKQSPEENKNIEDQNNSLLLQSNVLEELSSGSHSENEDITSISQNEQIQNPSFFSPIQKKQTEVSAHISVSSILPKPKTEKKKKEKVPQIKTDLDNVLETISKSPPSKSSSSESEEFSSKPEPAKQKPPSIQITNEVSIDSPLPPKKDILMTPPRVLPVQKRKTPQQLPILPVQDDEEFTFEESPGNSPVRNNSSSFINTSSPRPHVSMSPSAMSPTKRRKIIVVHEDIPAEPSSDINLEISDFHEEISRREDSSMIEGSFTEDLARVESVNDIVFPVSPSTKKKNSPPKNSSPQQKRKLSPRRQIEASKSDISSIDFNYHDDHSSSGSLSDDGSFNITEELRKLDECHKKNEIEDIASNLFIKSPPVPQPKSRLSSKQVVQLTEQPSDDQSSFLLKNRVLLGVKNSTIDDESTGFSLLNDKQQDSKHIRRSKKTKQQTFGK